MISIVIPVIRPDKANRCIEAIYANAGLPPDAFEIITEEDTDRVGCPIMVKRLVRQAQHSRIAFIGDDCIPQPGFLEKALNTMNQFPMGWGMVGFNDNLRNVWDKGIANLRRAPAHWMCHKKLLEFLDYEFFHTGYKHCYCDNELMDRCAEIGRYKFCDDAMIFHDHPLGNPKADDKDYQRVYSNEFYIHDLQLYRKRRSTNWTFKKPGAKNGTH
jgi:hypothetical protein